MAVTGITGATGLTGTTGTTGSSEQVVAENFQAFLTLLTTQLKSQNPLDPLDTNQFTQQLVQFAQVEQQMTTNASLYDLVSLQRATQTAAAMGFLGTTVSVDGATAKLTSAGATWTYAVNKPAAATINVTNASGQVVHTENRTLNAGTHEFKWSGKDAQGNTMPDGNYTISIVAKDATGQTVSVSTEVQGVVEGLDLTQSPAVLKINGGDYSMDKIRQILKPAA